MKVRNIDLAAMTRKALEADLGVAPPEQPMPYEDYKGYHKHHGKQFRRSRQQIKEGITRTAAFHLHLEELRKA